MMERAVLAIGGPTASGKTALALAVAERFDAVILSADAMQVYRGMNIGTAKASPEDQSRVRHVGIDCRDPDEGFDAADFIALADDLLAAGHRVVVAGGTSFYLRALQRGLVDTPDVDPVLRAELEAAEDLYEQLQAVDPTLAARLHPNDRVRLIRGVEVFRQAGVRLSDLQDAHAQAPDRVKVEGVWLDRPDLDERIDKRVLDMMDAGYLDEVRTLLARGVSSRLKPMKSLGYRHLCEHLERGLDLDEAVRRTQRDTRRFARKQRTWSNTLRYAPVGDDGLKQALTRAEGLWSGR